MNLKLIIGATICLGLFSCSNEEGKTTDHKKETKSATMNPFLQAYDTTYELPPFEQIETKHFKPAFLEGIKIQKEEIDQIVNNSSSANFENTILALENSGELLGRVSSVFYNLNSANTSDEMQEIANEIAPLMSAHQDEISLNEKLFSRIKGVWEESSTTNDNALDAESLKLIEKKYLSFVRSGANLNEDEKTELKKINEKLSLLTLKFGQNVLAETNNYQLIVENETELSGLPSSLKEAAAKEAKEAGMDNKWIFTLHNPSVMPFLQYADNRELRKEIWKAYQSRGNNNNAYNNNAIIKELVELRQKKAQLLGYSNHAEYKLEQSMAQNPENVFELLNQLWEPALNKAKEEIIDIEKLFKSDQIAGTPQAYDWRYYTEKIRQERYDLDEDEIKPFFSLENVQLGIFDLSEKLFGLKFIHKKDLKGYHEDVSVYEVTESNGEHVGLLMMDFHPRPSKRGGAWMTSYKTQSYKDGKRNAPIISIVCNFTKPTSNKPALLTFDEVETFFHEFGHALHGLLSDVQYKSLAGTNVFTDFVELPSQVMENWAGDPAFIKTYAKHYETNETISDELIEKMMRAATFDQGFATTEYLAASYLDMFYHTNKLDSSMEPSNFETKMMKEIGLIDEIIPRYRSTYFNHIFAGGYSAGYYSYIWSGVLDTDAFEAFKETSLFNEELANSFRTNILEKGGTEDPMELYVRFRGKKPNIEPLLNKRGLK